MFFVFFKGGHGEAYLKEGVQAEVYEENSDAKNSDM